jgi:hypothetical protein
MAKPTARKLYKLKNLPQLQDDCLQVIGEQLHMIKATPCALRTPTELLFVLKASQALNSIGKEHRDDKKELLVTLTTQTDEVLKQMVGKLPHCKKESPDESIDVE